MKCPYCNNEIPNNSIKCDICGVELTKEDRYSVNGITTSSKTIDKFGGVYFIISSLFMIGFGLFWTILTLGFATSNSILIPVFGFVIIGIGIIAYGVQYFITGINLFTGNEKYSELSKKITSIISKIILGGFFFFWFGFLIMADYQLLTEHGEGNIQAFFFTLIFWIFGFAALYSGFKKK